MSKRLLSSILILSMFFVTMSWVPTVPFANPATSASDTKSDSSPEFQGPSELTPLDEQILEGFNPYNVADDAPADGFLDPVQVEQSGYAASENLSARTDSYENLDYDLPIDVAHDWVADVAEVSVWNLEKLYATNGTYDLGVPGVNVNPNGTVDYYPLGWSADSTDTATYPDDVQLAAYDDSGRQYVMVESQGGKVGQNAFGHPVGTNIVWTQTVQNAPYTEDFLLDFDYFYLRGPLDKNPGVPLAITGNCSITVSIDGTPVWNMSLLTLSQRGVWTDSGVIPITIAGAPASFVFEIGLVIEGTLVLDKRYDYDDNGIDDGIGNAAYITVYMDDVSFIRATPPTAEQVQLEFTTGGQSSALTGSLGTYYTSITNSSYWLASPVPVALSANTSVSFDYKTRLLSHRFTDSNWRTDISSVGVAYTIDHGLSSDLTFYSYVGYLGDYEVPEMTIVFPPDWENVSISDPFLIDLTSSCTIRSGNLTVPTSIIDRLGWWEVKLESPNYAKSINSQISDAGWTDETIFRIDDITRVDVTIGTDTQTLGSLTDVNVTWFNPSDQIWVTELRTGGAMGQIYSSSQTFNSGSSPAGEWWVEVYWTNGTEVAYDMSRFEVHHTANLVANPAEITTDAGLIIKGLVQYTDGDTGGDLLEAFATLVANWSGSAVPMVPNPTQNWWEADFDTSLTGAGEFVIVVNASRPYYDDVSCQIQVHSVRVTRLGSPNAPWTAASWGENVSLTFNFEGYDYGTETWTGVQNNTDVSVNVNWTLGYWSVVEDISPGVYIMDLDTGIIESGTWLLNTTFNKPNHESKTLLLTLIISPTASSLSVIEAISARVDLDEPYSINMTYRDSNGDPLSGAAVVVDSVSPASGLAHDPVTEISGEPGNYTTTVTPLAAGVFTIRFVASITNAENATTVFVLVVNDVATVLDIPGTGSEEIGLTDSFNTTFRFEMVNGTGVENADISIIYSGGSSGALSWGIAEISLGDYSVEFSSTLSGTYLITIAASKPYHQSASDAFFLVVREISTNITCLNGTADLVSFGKDYQLFVSYTNGTGHGLVGANVSIENVVSDSLLTWGTTVPESPGRYSILLTPQAADTFTILVQATLSNHQTQFVLFTLTSTSIATTLTLLNASTSISLDQTFTVYLLYQDEDLSPLENATVIVQNPPAGVDFSAFEKLGGGVYRVTVIPEEVGTFDIIFKANKDGYQNGYTSFTLGASRIPTSLRTASGLSSETVKYEEDFELIVLYERIDTGANVSTATIDVQGFPSTGFDWDWDETENGYVITIIPEREGTWTFAISAQLAGHGSSSIDFILRVEPIQIQAVMLSSLLVVEGADFDVTVELTNEDNDDPVTGAMVSFRLVPVGTTGAGEFIDMEETDTPGVYSTTHRIPIFLETTQYSLEVKVDKDNYVVPGELFVQSFVKNNDPLTRAWPFIIGGGTFFVGLIILVGVMRVRSVRRKEQIEIDVMNKRRFDDADNIIGVIVMHKNSGIPVYSRIVKGGFEEGIVAAFISAVTHFREEFEMFDVEAMKVIPISDIIRAVQTKNLICAFVTIKSASMEHNRKMESYGEQVATYLDDFYTESRPTGALDSRIAEILDYVFDETMDGSLIKFYKVASDQQFPRRYKLLEQLLDDIETRHCARPVHLAQGVSTFGVSEAHGCTLVTEAIEKRFIMPCDEHEPTVEDMEFSEFFAKRNSNDET